MWKLRERLEKLISSFSFYFEKNCQENKPKKCCLFAHLFTYLHFFSILRKKRKKLFGQPNTFHIPPSEERSGDRYDSWIDIIVDI